MCICIMINLLFNNLLSIPFVPITVLHEARQVSSQIFFNLNNGCQTEKKIIKIGKKIIVQIIICHEIEEIILNDKIWKIRSKKIDNNLLKTEWRILLLMHQKFYLKYDLTFQYQLISCDQKWILSDSSGSPSYSDFLTCPGKLPWWVLWISSATPNTAGS